MPHRTVRSRAWLLSGLTQSVAGELMLHNGRLVFMTRDGHRMLDTALGEISAVTFPWYYFGGGMKLRIGADSYRVSFARPGNLPEPADDGDIITARESGAAWKAALTASATRR